MPRPARLRKGAVVSGGVEPRSWSPGAGGERSTRLATTVAGGSTVGAVPVLSTRPIRRVVRLVGTKLGLLDRLTTVEIDFEGVRFSFTAPRPLAHHARDAGVENIISRTLHHHLPVGGGFIDVGANYGFITMVGADRVGAGGRVLAVEIDPAVAAVLDSTATVNGRRSSVRVVGEGVGAPDGGGPTVDGLVADSAIDRVDAVKIDVDGTEPDVLAGMEAVVAAHRPLLVVEVPVDEDAAARTVDWLQQRYEFVVDMDGLPVDPGAHPPNVFASHQPIDILRQPRA